ncbi:MAG TPA: GWxTD domain-containing protein [bacterium (Candidatus Stahlbacteria)]|nr:GWxTD domain-containing protein [Candidatus Stahlbacteria bacterium]
MLLLLLSSLLLLQIDFKYVVGTFFGEDRPKLRIYFEIPNDQLTFIKTEKGFTAKFSLTCILRDDKEFGDIWIKEASLPTYEQTTLSSEYIEEEVSIAVEPKAYKLELKVKDLNSNREESSKDFISVPDYSRYYYPFAISSLIFRADSALVPEKIYRRGAKVGLFFEVYDFRENKEVFPVHYKIGKIEDSIWVEDPQQVNPVTIEVQTDSLDIGKNEVYVWVENFKKQDIIQVKTTFLDDDMIGPLRYIATAKEVNKIIKAADTEKRKYWDEFWKKRDPTPGTERNEAKEEFIERVEYVNTHYTSMRKGWQTDRGRIYIKLGKPDEIERHPFELDSPPYEIWYYYARRLMFIFKDRHGFGDYVLEYPTNW